MEVLRLDSKTLKLELLDIRTGRTGKREGSEGDYWVCGWANVGCSRDRSDPLLLHAPVHLFIQPSSQGAIEPSSLFFRGWRRTEMERPPFFSRAMKYHLIPF